MYYEEKIIDGVLCFRTKPSGDFIPVSPEEMTRRIVELEARNSCLEETLQEARGHSDILFDKDKWGTYDWMDGSEIYDVANRLIAALGGEKERED